MRRQLSPLAYPLSPTVLPQNEFPYLFYLFFALFWGSLCFPPTRQKHIFFAGVRNPAKRSGPDNLCIADSQVGFGATCFCFSWIPGGVSENELCGSQKGAMYSEFLKLMSGARDSGDNCRAKKTIGIHHTVHLCCFFVEYPLRPV